MSHVLYGSHHDSGECHIHIARCVRDFFFKVVADGWFYSSLSSASSIIPNLSSHTGNIP